MNQTTDIISKNVREIRDAIGLSRKDFALLSDISQTTLSNIESGKVHFRIKSLNGITEFTKITLSELCKEHFKPNKNLREKLSARYSNNLEVTVLLEKIPSIPYAIKYKLLHDNFLDKPKEIREIRTYFEKYGWFYKGNSLHIALKRMSREIAVDTHPTKKNTYIYKINPDYINPSSAKE